MLHAATSQTSEAKAQDQLAPSRPRARKLTADHHDGRKSFTAGGGGASWLTGAQSIYGNQAILRALNHPNSSQVLQRKCACEESGTDCASCAEDKEGMLHRSAANHTKRGKVPPIVHEVLRSPGQPLDGSTREYVQAQLSPRLSRTTGLPAVQQTHIGPMDDRYEEEADHAADQAMNHPLVEQGAAYDFNQVRVHTDARAAESARAINALAYTAGQHIVFGTGQYAPRSTEGRRLIAHELAHVVQQNSSASRSAQVVQRQPDKNPKPPAKAAPKDTRVLSYKTVPSGFVEGDCGAFSWTVQWSIDKPAGPKGGFVVQGLTFNIDVKDCAGKAVKTQKQTLSEAWPTNAGKKVSKWAETGDVNDDTYADPTSGKKTKGVSKTVASAAYYDGITLPSDFKENNPDTVSGILPSTKTIHSLAGGTAAIAHNATATWDCCPDKSDKTKVVKS